ncbi:MAG: quinate/shikimate dehydrogenase, partial [Eubacterium ventriosum]
MGCISEITGHTRLTGLLGSPVSHSKSPLMHNEAYRLLGLDYVYLCFD